MRIYIYISVHEDNTFIKALILRRKNANTEALALLKSEKAVVVVVATSRRRYKGISARGGGSRKQHVYTRISIRKTREKERKTLLQPAEFI